MSSEGISSKGSLRFDEFPTSMKATQSFWDHAQHAYWLLENARPSESRRPPLLQGEHARTPPSAFPFLHITMSKSRWTWSEPHARTPNGSKSSIRSQRQSKLFEKTRASPASVRRIARSRSVPQEAWQPARKVHLGSGTPNVKGDGAKNAPALFLRGGGNQATFLPECVATLHMLTAR
jgi:hypothetical protein